MYTKQNKRHSVNKRHIYFPFLILFLIIVSGVVGYMVIEKYTLFEALYMTIITVSTVGYEEVRDLSQDGMIFTMFLIVLSFGVFAYVISAVTKFFMDGDVREYLVYYKANKVLDKMKNHVIVCGYGRNGSQATHDLLEHNESIVIIERKIDVIEKSSNPRLIFIQGDATQDEVLERAHIYKAKALITTFPSDADNLFVVLTARQMNPEMRIISRASDEHSDVKLKRAGASNIIMPDIVGGRRMAKLVSKPDIVDFLDAILLKSGELVNLEEIACSKMNQCFIGKTIGELNIRRISGASLIGLKNADGSFVFNPSPEIRLNSFNKLFALGTPEQIENLKKALEA